MEKESSKTGLKLFESSSFRGKIQIFDAECKDVTKILPDGASSIVVPKDTEAWQVFTAVSFEGNTATLSPGTKYECPTDMHLNDPVKSFRKAP